VLASFFIVAVAALILHFMGRNWWCECGEFSVWSSEIYSQHNSQHLFDAYTFTHILHGVGFYGILWLFHKWLGPWSRFLLVVGLESTWEIIENTSWVIEKYREGTISLGYFGDSIANSMLDILACILGYGLAMWLPVWWSVGGFLLTEAILVYLIRDSLLLNILMIIWPLEVVKDWQMGG